MGGGVDGWLQWSLIGSLDILVEEKIKFLLGKYF